MALSQIDRELVQECLTRQEGAWEKFVERYLGLVVHVVNHTAQSRSIQLADQDREDLASDVFLAIVDDNFAILRRFRGESSLPTYLTVIARRVIVRELLKRRASARLEPSTLAASEGNGAAVEHEERIANREQVEKLLQSLDGDEAKVVRLYHLDGQSYREISKVLGIVENSIGPLLSRARAKMRRAADTSA